MLGAQAVEIGVFFGLTEHAGQLVARAFQSGGVGLNRLGLGDMQQRVARGSAHADICLLYTSRLSPQSRQEGDAAGR